MVNARESMELENLATKAGPADEEEYVYRGPKNKTGLFKNSLILKDLTGYVEEPEEDKNVTMDAGTQTIVHDEPP